MTEDNDTTENTPDEDYSDYNYGDGINRISIEQKGHFLYGGKMDLLILGSYTRFSTSLIKRNI